jgi:glycosyltransferase involved in cell wall biosynthesis
MPSICFASPAYYGDLIGGAEMVIKNLAHDFRQNGWTVSFVSAGAREEESRSPDGDRVFYYRGGRIFTPTKAFSMKRALGRADADVYYQRVTGILTKVTADFCRRHQKLMVWAAAHNDDCIKWRHLKELRKGDKFKKYNFKGKVLGFYNRLRMDLAYPSGIRRAHLRLAHLAEQQHMLKRHFGLSSELLYKGYQRPRVGLPVQTDDVRQKILWIANLRDWKRPEVFVDLARELAEPGRAFYMIGGAYRDAERQQRFDAVVATTPGLDYLGSMPHEQVMAHMANADLLVHTSPAEGLANVFIEAWMSAVPVLSFQFNPDQIIEKYAVGKVAQTFEELTAMGRAMLSGEDRPAAEAYEAVNELFDLGRHCTRLRQLIAARGGPSEEQP